MLSAVRTKHSSYDASLSYAIFDELEQHQHSVRTLNVLESTELVDGIGGTTWEGCLVLTKLVERMLHANTEMSPKNSHFVELGCGTGLCGIVASKFGAKVSLTDRECDLAQLNIDAGMKVECTEISTAVMSHLKRLKAKPSVEIQMPQLQSLSMTDKETDIVALNLSWDSAQNTSSDSNNQSQSKQSTDNSEVKDQNIETKDARTSSNINSEVEPPQHNVTSFLALRGPVDFILGAEITCLHKQQTKLIGTIAQLCADNPSAVALLTFDDLPPPLSSSRYEADFTRRMREEQRFLSAVVSTAEVEWIADSDLYCGDDGGGSVSEDALRNVRQRQEIHHPSSSSGVNVGKNVKYAVLRDLTDQTPNDLHRLSFPRLVPPDTTNTPSYSTLPLPPLLPSSTAGKHSRKTADSTTHHVIAFYRPTAVNTCSRCHSQFFRTPLLNPSTACRHHSGLFVCRFHPAETRLSIDGHGDALGYYGTGSEGWAARFWDCCGSEDPQALGCCASRHTAY